MLSLGDALKNKFKQDKPLQEQVNMSTLLETAAQILQDFAGKDNARHIKPLFVKNRTLTITCSNSALSQEIHLSQAKIVEEINAKFGQKVLDRIRYLL